MTIFLWIGILSCHLHHSLIMEEICICLFLCVHVNYNNRYLDKSDMIFALLFTGK